MSSPAYTEFRRHEATLIHVRWQNKGLDSREEDAILESMDDAWWQLTEEERCQIDAQPPRSLIRSVVLAGRRVEHDIDVFDVSRVRVRTLAEVA
jgi:hypothetical protein